MTIRCESMIPLPMQEQDTAGSEIWETDVVRFEKGKKYLIEAPSGRGKTSLLYMIYGLRDDYRGNIFIDDRDISGFSRINWSAIRKQKLSYIFQGLELFDGLTALENIQLKNGITGHLSKQQIEVMAGELGIEAFLHRKAGILSFGQQQRVAIIRAICQPFEYLLADECFSHIDQENSLRAFRVIQQACDSQGAGLILTALRKTSLSDELTVLKL